MGMAGRFAAGCRGTVPDPAQDMRPRFSLSWQRKAAAPGGKETAARGRHGPSRGDALTISNRCGVRFKSPAGCALPFSVWKCFPAFGGLGENSGWLRILPPSVSAAAAPTLGGGIQRRGPLPPPLSRFKGVRGEIEIPPGFSFGGVGAFLFSKEKTSHIAPCHEYGTNLLFNQTLCKLRR